MILKRYLSSLLLAGTLLSPVITSGCGGTVAVGYRARDPYYHDYHRWDDGEVRFYNQWTVETHRPAGRDYRRLKRNEQRDYWNWRHNHH